MASIHVPAWKRLGLKLKYAKEIPERTDSILPTVETPSPLKKRKLFNESPTGHPVLQLDNQSTESRKEVPIEGEGAEYEARPGQSVTTEENTSNSSRKRKSVSFSEDTKITDGGTNLKNRRRQVTSGQGGKAHSNPGSHASQDESSTSKLLTRGSGTSKTSGNTKKAKSTPTSTDSTQLTGMLPGQSWTPQHLQYLEEYQSSRSVWKFNKARQTYLIKHALDLDKIPSDYDCALRDYILGLEGSSVRLWLRSRAQKTIDADDADIVPKDENEIAALPSKSEADSSQKEEDETLGQGSSATQDGVTQSRHLQYKSLVSRVREAMESVPLYPGEGEEGNELLKVNEWEKRFYQRRRAEILLWATSRDASRTDEPTANGSEDRSPNSKEGPTGEISRNPESNTQTLISMSRSPATNGIRKLNATTSAAPDGTSVSKKRKRKRASKRREAMDESSSESSSSSSSSSDDEDGARPMNIAVNGQKGAQTMSAVKLKGRDSNTSSDRSGSE